MCPPAPDMPLIVCLHFTLLLAIVCLFCTSFCSEASIVIDDCVLHGVQCYVWDYKQIRDVEHNLGVTEDDDDVML